jgi:hypothetical protein
LASNVFRALRYSALSTGKVTRDISAPVRRLEELDRVAVRVQNLNLAVCRPGFHGIPEHQPGGFCGARSAVTLVMMSSHDGCRSARSRTAAHARSSRPPPDSTASTACNSGRWRASVPASPTSAIA